MAHIPVRELRNHTAGVLARVQSGEEVVITVNGISTAKLAAFPPARKSYLTKAEFLALRPKTSDLTLARDIAALTGDTTDDLGSIL